MSLSLIIRGASRTNAYTVLFQNVLRSANSNVVNFSQLSNGVNNSTPFASSKPTTNVNPFIFPAQRKISLSEPRQYTKYPGNHTLLWSVEKALSAALLGIIPFAILEPSFIMNNVVAVSVVMHQHWGIESVITDYLRPSVVGLAFAKISHFLVYIISAATLGGLLYFNYNDIGIACTVRRLWAIKD